MNTSFSPPLSGYSILLTRPEGRGAGLVRLLEEAGATVAQIPLLAIDASPEATEGMKLLNLDELQFLHGCSVLLWGLLPSAS